MVDRDTYCKDCDRSIYGKYHDCDINIENEGRYVKGDHKCFCKIVDGKRAEKYPWEGENHDKSIENQWKREELKPCPWCHEPVHVEFDPSLGYMVTCGNYYCNCPEKIYWPSEREAVYRWNSGATQYLINEKPGIEAGPHDCFTRKRKE